MSDRAVRSILVVRLSALGDIAMASPVVDALRGRYPQARIAWLVQPEGAPLLAGHPAIDEVIVWSRGDWRRWLRTGRWVRLAREFAVLRRRLRAQRFDLSIDLQGLLKSGVWGWLAGARERIGLGSREGSARLMTRVVPRAGEHAELSSEYRHLCRELGLADPGYRLHVAPAAADREAAGQRLRAHGIEGDFVVLCPFTTRPQKHWFERRWSELAQALHARDARPIVILGGPGDRAAAARIRESGDTPIVDLAGTTGIGEAAAIIARAAVVVGVDTGLTHVALAFERPTVALFGSTLPYARTGRANVHILYHALPCSPCRRHPTCGGAFACMRTLRVPEVMDAVARVDGRTAELP